MEEAYNAHIAAASGLYEAQTRLMDARRRVAVLDGELCAAKAEQQKMVVDLDRKRRAARDAETAFMTAWPGRETGTTSLHPF